MSKGNLFLGYGRGAIGDVVLARVKGQQVTKARNRNPNNPKTPAQQRQRAKFSAALLFHKQMSARLFKFAFQDKTERESDYNAFMRNNAALSPYIPFEYTTAQDRYAVFAPFILTSGELPSVDYYFDSGSAGEQVTLYIRDFEGSGADLNTVADLTNYLISRTDTDYRIGDILTFVFYTSSLFPREGEPFASVVSGHKAYVNYNVNAYIKQIILDSSDTRLVSSLVPGWIAVSGAIDIRLRDNGTEIAAIGSDAVAAAVIHSRNSSGGLLVSDAVLSLTQDALQVYQYTTESQEWLSQVMTDWDASQEAILQGAAASPSPSSLPFRVLRAVDDNTGTSYSPTNGVYVLPSSASADFRIYIQTPVRLTQADITTSPSVSGANWNVDVIDLTAGWQGQMFINPTASTSVFQNNTDYTINFGSLGSAVIRFQA